MRPSPRPHPPIIGFAEKRPRPLGYAGKVPLQPQQQQQQGAIQKSQFGDFYDQRKRQQARQQQSGDL